MPDKPHWTLAQAVPESPDTTSLILTGGDAAQFAGRKPGQFATIRVLREDGAWSEPHPFTLSCAPEDQNLRVTIKKAGEFTSTAPDLKPGTPIQCAGPFGTFCRDIDQRDDIVMIAGGVGVTPFLSVLRHFRNIQAKNKVTLVWCNKTHADAFCCRELAETAAEINLRVIHVLSREPDLAALPQAPHVDYVSGRFTRDIIERFGIDPRASFYLCGPPAMQDTVLAELQSCGIEPDRVEKEKFVFTPPPRKEP